jgi:hypothetical protein
VLAVLLAGGCGGGTTTVTVAGSPSPRGAATQTQATTAAGAVGVEAEPVTRTVSLETLQSPTGNIGCIVVRELARCDIRHRQWSVPARPSSCPNIVDYGQGLQVGRSGQGQFVCAGDTADEPRSARLAYGTASSIAGFTCASRRTGMTCTDPATGHGFFLSVQSYRAF